MMKKIFVTFLFVFVAVVMITAQPLLRKGWMDIQTMELNDSLKKITRTDSGLFVVSVGEQGTGHNLKIEPGDVLVNIGGNKLVASKQLREVMMSHREGDLIMAEVVRKRKIRVLTGVVAPMLKETSEDYVVSYERVPFEGGYLSMIISRPAGDGPFPVVLFIPGYMCYSLDNLGAHPYGQITSRLTKEGFMVVRVEKSGEGASISTPDCRSVGYWKEVDGFVAGLEKICSLPYADTNNLFIFGHSLGAIQAPFVAKGFPVKGIIIEGTSADSWFEYILDMFRYQNPIMGVDPAENEEMIAKAIPLLYRFLVLKEDPAVLAQNPEYDSLLTEMMQYNGVDLIWDRHYSFWQELQSVNQAAAWRDTKANVLVMRGSGDLEAFSNEQHELIVRTVNHYRPGAASFVLIPNSDHAFCKSNTPEESYQNSQIRGYHFTRFNDEVIRIVSQWINELMAY